MRITVDNNKFIFTGWPLMQQVNAMGAVLTLTSNDPYPCFMASIKGHILFFTENGGDVTTMEGTFKSFGFHQVIDVREIITNLQWKEGWEMIESHLSKKSCEEEADTLTEKELYL